MNNFWKIFAILISVTIILFAGIQLIAENKAPSVDDCLACHDDKDISKVKNGKTISLEVKKATLQHSVHGKLLCVECHKGFNIEEVPHKANIQPIECIGCHKDAPGKHSFHPQMSFYDSKSGSGKEIFNCKGCHGTHDIVRPTTSGSKLSNLNAVEFCGRCHPEQKAEHMKSEHEIAFLNKNPDAPTCIYCHSKPITKYWIKDEIELKEKQQQLCLSCHNAENGKSKTMKTIKFNESNHGKVFLGGRKEAASCIDCHGIHNIQKSDSTQSLINKFKVADLCRKCHISINQEFMTTAHGMALQRGDNDAPSCIKCHNEHDVMKSPITSDKHLYWDFLEKSSVWDYINKEQVTKNRMINCISCHANEEFIARHNFQSFAKVHDFLPYVDKHLKNVRCVDCHSANSNQNMPHNILPRRKAIRQCEHCHEDNTHLLNSFSKFTKQTYVEKDGFFKGTFLRDGGMAGISHNNFIDSIVAVILGLITLFLIIHGISRWYFKRGRGTN